MIVGINMSMYESENYREMSFDDALMKNICKIMVKCALIPTWKDS